MKRICCGYGCEYGNGTVDPVGYSVDGRAGAGAGAGAATLGSLWPSILSWTISWRTTSLQLDICSTVQFLLPPALCRLLLYSYHTPVENCRLSGGAHWSHTAIYLVLDPEGTRRGKGQNAEEGRVVEAETGRLVSVLARSGPKPAIMSSASMRLCYFG